MSAKSPSKDYDIPLTIYPRYNKLNRSSQRNTNTNDEIENSSFISSHENKLPVNLFHSATEYNKMLITNGRSIRKSNEPEIEGFLDNLEFINEPIFQTC